MLAHYDCTVSSPQPIVRDRFDDVKTEHGRVGAHRGEQPRMRRGVVLLWSVLAAVVLTVLGILGLLFMMQTRDVPAPMPSATATATVAPAPVSLENYEAFILNATGDESRGVAMQAELEALGWAPERIHLPNADTNDFPQTTLVYVDEADADAARSLAASLGIEIVEQSAAYAGLATSDALHPIVIVLGADAQ